MVSRDHLLMLLMFLMCCIVSPITCMNRHIYIFQYNIRLNYVPVYAPVFASTNLYCLLTGAHGCRQLAQSCYQSNLFAQNTSRLNAASGKSTRRSHVMSRNENCDLLIISPTAIILPPCQTSS